MVGQDEVLPEVPLVLRRLLLEDVAREGVASLDLALGGQLEALLRARMGLHLRHNGVGQYGRTRMVARSDRTRRVALWPQQPSAAVSSGVSRSSRRSLTRWPTRPTRAPRWPSWRGGRGAAKAPPPSGPA